MPKYYDEDGNVVEFPTPEEIADMKAKAEKAAELEEKQSEAQKKLEEYESKENKKKYDFENLRRILNEKEDTIRKLKEEGTSEADKKVLEEKLKEYEETVGKFSEEKRVLAEQLKKQEDKEKEKLIIRKNKLFEGIEDEEMRKKVQYEYENSLAIDDTSEEGIQERFNRAHLLATGRRPAATKLAVSYGGGYNPEDHGERDFVQTDKGKDIYNQMFPQIAKAKEAQKNNS